MIGLHDHIFIMLDNQNGISDIAQVFQSRYQPGVITLMQSNAGFVQDIKYINKLGSNLSSKPYPLGFAAG